MTKQPIRNQRKQSVLMTKASEAGTTFAWSAPVALDKDHAELCSWLRGRQTAAQLAERWARRRKVSAAAARNWVKDMLRHLGELLIAC